MTGFTSLDLLNTLTNIVEILCIAALLLAAGVCGWLTWKDWQRANAQRDTSSAPSNVTVLRPEPGPFDWADEGDIA